MAISVQQISVSHLLFRIFWIQIFVLNYAFVTTVGMWWTLGLIAPSRKPPGLLQNDIHNMNMKLNYDLQEKTANLLSTMRPNHHLSKYLLGRKSIDIPNNGLKSIIETTSSHQHSNSDGNKNQILEEQTLIDWCQLPGLSQGQRRLCLLYQDHMYGVGKGAQYGIFECQYQFRNQKWNCSIKANDETVFGPILKIPSRETAFTHAINSAGVVHAISRLCRQGILSSCGCAQVKRPRNLESTWKWDGCGDNLKYGYKFAKEFIDIREREIGQKLFDRQFQHVQRFNHPNNPFYNGNSDYHYTTNDSYTAKRQRLRGYGSKGGQNRKRNKYAKSLMNLHNNEVGRRAVYYTSSVLCNCLGVSGSCAMKTCWLQNAPFRKIGQILKDKYDTAQRVKLNRKQNSLQIVKDKDTIEVAHRVTKKSVHARTIDAKQLALGELVFLKQSPDFCKTDIRLGLNGTKGRVCGLVYQQLYTADSTLRYKDNEGSTLFNKNKERYRRNNEFFTSQGTTTNIRTRTELPDNLNGLEDVVAFHGGGLNELLTLYHLSSSTSYDNEQEMVPQNSYPTSGNNNKNDNSILNDGDNNVLSHHQFMQNNMHNNYKNEKGPTQVSNMAEPLLNPAECYNLCCGRGYKTKIITLQQRCNCKFHWCCNVECALCSTNVTLYICK